MNATVISAQSKISALTLGLLVLAHGPNLFPAEAALPAAGQPLPANDYAAQLVITHLDISVQADFQSNRVATVVKASIENTSPDPVNQASFRLCSTANDRHFHAEVHRIRWLDESGDKELNPVIREVPHPEIKDSKLPICEVPLPRPVRPGERFRLLFAYTMRGKPDHTGAPIEQSKDGIKEIYLRGGDYRWCPMLYHDPKTTVSRTRRTPTWTLTVEAPQGYVAVTDGELVRQAMTNGAAKADWKSLVPGTPHLYVGPYKVVRRHTDGLTFEMYAPDEERLRKTVPKLEEYARLFNLYCDLYGNPGVSTYRIVCSAVAGVGVGTMAGQTIDMSMMTHTRHVAHEMAHLWWGQWVSTRGPGWKFLSEAMAEFSARWVLRAVGDEDFNDSLSDACILGWKQRHFCTYFPVTEPPRQFSVPLMLQEGYDPSDSAFRNYSWGPLVVNHLRLMLGDERFFKGLKTFLQDYGGNEAGIEEFLQTLTAVSGTDVTAEVEGLLWSTGFASYRLAEFASEKADGSYRTTVRIANEGDYGLTCPLLLRTIGGDQRAQFQVAGKQEKEFVFTTPHKVIEAVIDPDMTALQYHPEQKLRLWKMMLNAMDGYGNNEAYGKSYIYYAQGDFKKAVNPISDYLRNQMTQAQADTIDDLLKKDAGLAPYVFMRGVFHLALGDSHRGEQDVKSAFPCMLRALIHKDAVRVPGAYYQVGAIARKDLGEYLALLELIAGREFSFENSLDEPGKRQKVQEWLQWWDTDGNRQRLDLGRLKEESEAKRKAFIQRSKLEHGGQPPHHA